MSTVGTILDEAEERLHDPDNKIWARRELLDLLNEGYRDIAVKSAMLVEFLSYDSPGRWGYGSSTPWEVEHLRPARAWVPFVRYSDSRFRASYKWEVEHLDGRTPTNSGDCITQPWEIAHKSTDRPLPFHLQENNIKTIRASWDLRKISGTGTKDLDGLGYDWWEDTGLPQWLWQDTLGTKAFGIFPLQAGYNQSYALTGTSRNGSPREYSGDRTYNITSIADPCRRDFNGYTSSGDSLDAPSPAWRFTQAATDTSKSFVTQVWEKEQVEGKTTFSAGKVSGVFAWEEDHGIKNFPSCFVLGLPRQFSGRDYLSDIRPYGSPRGWQSSDGQLGIIQAKIPDTLIVESDSPKDIHARLHKYLRSYVCWQALDRKSPGRNPALAAFYRLHYQFGLKVFQLTAVATWRDMDWQRDTVAVADRRPPRVQLPPEFPRVL